MNRLLLPVAAFVVAAILAAAPARAADLATDQLIKLPDGRVVKVLSVSRIEYSKGVMALMLRYQTSLSIDERKALSTEVDEVWHVAQKDVEHLGYNEAILSSNEVPKGIIFTASRMLNFIYERGSDGKWTRLSNSDFMAAQ